MLFCIIYNGPASKEEVAFKKEPVSKECTLKKKEEAVSREGALMKKDETLVEEGALKKELKETVDEGLESPPESSADDMYVCTYL